MADKNQKIPVPTAAKTNHASKRPVNWWILLVVVCALLQGAFLFVIDGERRAYLSAKQKESDRIQLTQQTTFLSPAAIEKLEQSFLDEQGVINFIETMDRTRGAFDAFELTFTSDVPEGKTTPSLSITIAAAGTPANAKKLLRSLLSSRYVIDAEQVALTSEDGFTAHAQLTITARLYVAEHYEK
ncbi:hypothetical protein HY468_02605 [Candidatus Roizmanbacteria bacterium]|nr:hypothetical protein [Candidatus Roizmanbacteria bacterium]